MPVDSSIYSQQVTPDFFGTAVRGVETGMKLRDMMDARALRQKQLEDENQIRDLYKANTTFDANGQPIVNRKAVTAGMFALNPEKALAADKEFATSDKLAAETKAAQQKQQADEAQLIYNAASSAVDQPSYDAALADLSRRGIKVDHLPKQFDPQHVEMYKRSSMTYLQRLDQENKKVDQDRQAKELKLKQDEAKRRAGAPPKGMQYQVNPETGEMELVPVAIPTDTKHFVDTLSTKNANKTSIRNQINAVTQKWDKLSDDQKVMQGGMLLKTLNSPEGADAIGAEEVKRLGSKLEFAMGNLFDKTRPIQFGRDLSGFKEQAEILSNSLSSAIDTNQNEIDSRMGRKPKATMPASNMPPAREGMVLMKDTEGNTRYVPKDKVGAAIANGGSRVDNIAGGR